LPGKKDNRDCACQCNEREGDESRAGQDPDRDESKDNGKGQAGDGGKPLVPDPVLFSVTAGIALLSWQVVSKKQVRDKEVDQGGESEIEEKTIKGWDIPLYVAMRRFWGFPIGLATLPVVTAKQSARRALFGSRPKRHA